MPSWPIWLLLHAALAIAATAWARGYALRRRLLDQPGERRSHATATPRGGGISLVAALLLASAWLAWRFPAQREWFGWFAAGLSLVAGIGWLDDHRPLSPWTRLLVHGLAALLLAVGVWRGGAGHWMALAGFVLAMGLTNVWNFMDGIDGLAASQAGIVAAGLAVALASPWDWLALALAGAVLGFLPFNFPKARIFMGDVGSGALGFALAALLALAMTRGRETPIDFLMPFLPVTAFLVDAAFTLTWRMLNGQRWWTPHVEHAYQRWARRWGHVRVTMGYSLFTMLCVGVWLTGSGNRSVSIIILFIMCYAAAGGMWWWSRRLTD